MGNNGTELQNLKKDQGGLPIESEKFFKVPNGIFEFSLKPSEFMVYCCLCKFRNNRTNSCFPSRKTVAELCGVSVKTVDAALKQLCALGLIQKRKRQGRKGNFYSNKYTIPNPGERV